MEKGIKVESNYSRSIRLKLTDKCSWDCNFCHKEWWSWFDDFKWDSLTQETIWKLKEILDLQEIHYTWGEPTSLRNIEELTKWLISEGLILKTTTNWQFSLEKLISMINSGLKSYNFSIHSLDPAEFLETQNWKNLEWAQTSVERQKNIILDAIKLWVKVKINTVIANEDDINRWLSVFNFAKENDISIRFLEDLNNKSSWMNPAKRLAEEIIWWTKFVRKISPWSSNEVTLYKDKDWYEFWVKNIWEFRLPSLCSDCNLDCREWFYGIRLERIWDDFLIKLCIDRNDKKSIMPIDQFFRSEQLKEIISLRQ